MNDDSKRNNGKFIDFNENEHRSIKGLRLTTNLTWTIMNCDEFMISLVGWCCDVD